MTSVLEGTGAELLPAILKSPRALVFLSVPWSGEERVARGVFRSAVSQMELDLQRLGIDSYLLHIDNDAVSEEWLRSFNPQQSISHGYGEILFLESGMLITIIARSPQESEAEILARVRSVWQSST